MNSHYQSLNFVITNPRMGERMDSPIH